MDKQSFSSILLLCFRNEFTVLLGDTIFFQPCGDSQGTNLIFTDNREVFEQCIPQSNITSDIIYNYIGKILLLIHVIY